MSGPTGPTDRLSRLLALVPYLLAHPDVRLAEVAEVFSIGVPQLRKDLELLWMCGLPGYGPGDLIDLSWGEDDTVTVTHDAGMSRPLRLNTAEALALVVALRTLADVPGLQDRDAVDRALVKLETAAGAAADSAPRVAVDVEGAGATLAQITRALEHGRALHLTYYTASRDQTTERDVDPMRVVLVEGRSYLEAWCRRAEGVRLFRVDRIDAITVLDEPAAPPPEAEPVDVRGGVFHPAPQDPVAVLDLEPSAHWVAEYYPNESVVALAGNPQRLRVTLRAADEAWLRRLVLGLGNAVQVHAPAGLADDVRAEAHRALAAYR